MTIYQDLSYFIPVQIAQTKIQQKNIITGYLNNNRPGCHDMGVAEW